MEPYNIRKYNGIEDLVKMQELVSAIFTIRSDLHTGDIAWQRFQHENDDDEWPTYLVEYYGELVAWGWIDHFSNLLISAHPSHPEATCIVADKLSQDAPKGRMEVEIFESEGHMITNLLKCGFKEMEDGPFYLRMYNDLNDLQEVKLPEGFSARYIDANSDLKKRVNVHRESWHPSKVTYKSYGNVIRAPTYCPRLDWVIKGPDGDFASYCLIWFDNNSKIGLLEPVGTSPGFRGMGLSKAVCTMALMELKEMGGVGAIVNTYGGKDRPIPARLYRSLGFREIARTRTFFKEI